jgi:hypothetical protein
MALERSDRFEADDILPLILCVLLLHLQVVRAVVRGVTVSEAQSWNARDLSVLTCSPIIL